MVGIDLADCLYNCFFGLNVGIRHKVVGIFLVLLPHCHAAAKEAGDDVSAAAGSLLGEFKMVHGGVRDLLELANRLEAAAVGMLLLAAG